KARYSASRRASRPRSPRRSCRSRRAATSRSCSPTACTRARRTATRWPTSDPRSSAKARSPDRSCARITSSPRAIRAARSRSSSTSMNNVEQRLVGGRTAALTLALRRGDAFGAARAAARLRLPGVPLTRQQLALARRARTAIGRSLIHARYFPTTHRDVILPPTPVGTPAATAGPGSSGGGTGGGLGGGGIGPGPTAPPGFRIFTLDVIDEETGAPLANVCVNIGQPTCDAQHRTDAFGRWQWPISKSETTKWDMQLTLATYNTWKESFLVLPGDEPHKVVKMTKAFGGGGGG